MAGKQEGKPLSFKAIEMMKPGDKDKADVAKIEAYVSPVVQLGLSLFSTVTQVL